MQEVYEIINFKKKAVNAVCATITTAMPINEELIISKSKIKVLKVLKINYSMYKS
jgi:hypothetical protein